MSTYLITLREDEASLYTDGVAKTMFQLIAAGIMDFKLVQSQGWKEHTWRCVTDEDKVAWLTMQSTVVNHTLVSAH